MATTTNYSWSTPDDTDLVKNGASAIRALGTAIDTTTKNLNPSTTLGDIEYRSSSANTNTRLAIGSNGNILTVSGGVPTWAAPAASGSMTLLSTTTLNGATVSINSISGSYKSLYAVIYGVTNLNYAGTFRVAPNGTTNITDTTTQNAGITTTWQGYQNDYLFLSSGVSGKRPVNNNSTNFWALSIDNYASTASTKGFIVNGGFQDADNGYRPFTSFGQIRTTSAITSLVFSNNAGDLDTGTVLLYGVN